MQNSAFGITFSDCSAFVIKRSPSKCKNHILYASSYWLRRSPCIPNMPIADECVAGTSDKGGTRKIETVPPHRFFQLHIAARRDCLRAVDCDFAPPSVCTCLICLYAPWRSVEIVRTRPEGPDRDLGNLFAGLRISFVINDTGSRTTCR